MIPSLSFFDLTSTPANRSISSARQNIICRKITTSQAMLDEICATLGGRAAEEVFLGRISTGAANDLERVTKSAYAMVVYYGMSDKMPNISYYDSTGQDYGFTKPYGEERAAIIDKEVSRIVSEQYERAKELLRKHAEGHNQLTEVLLSREVIYTEDVERIFGKRQWESRTDEILRLNEEARRKESESSDEPKSESDSQNAAADDSTSISTPPEIPADCK